MRFWLSLLIGTSIGVLLGLVMAPQQGEQTRQRLMEQARTQTERLRRNVEALRRQQAGPVEP